jgi:hypothetical protein
MSLTVEFMLTLLVAAFVAGVGWSLGCWVVSRLLH